MGHVFFHHDEDERRKWQEPYSILRGVGLEQGMVFVDVGCGPGFFTLPAAEIVGEEGRVYAIDSDPRSIEMLAERVASRGLGNIILKAAKGEETVLFEGKADMVFFGIDLHDFEEPEKVLANARRMLKTGGRVLDLDWKKKDMAMGPPLWKRLTEDDACRLISGAGFRIVAVRDCGKYHYLVIGEKS